MADQEDKNKIARAEAERYQKQVQEAFEELSQTEAGQIVLGYLMNKCLFHTTTLALDNTGKVNTDAMIHNEARRRLYLQDIRGYIPVNIRRKIEN